MPFMRCRLVALLFALTGCGNEGLAQTRLAPVSPLDLRGVFLGIRASDLLILRPGTKFVPYAGPQENLDGHSVTYWLEGAEERLDSSAQVFRVSTSKTIMDSIQFQQEWEALRKRSLTALGPTRTCWRDTTRYSAIYFGETWRTPDSEVDIMRSIPKPIASLLPVPIDTARIGLGVRRVGENNEGRTPIECPLKPGD